MPATIDADEHKYYYVNGANAQTRLAGFVDWGPAYVHTGHWLAQVGKEFLPAAVGGKIAVDYHFLEWIFTDLLLFTKAFMELCQGWSILLPLLSQLQAELGFVKIPTVPMNENQIRELITSWGKENLSVAQRTVDVNGTAQAAITSADWHSAATNKMVAGPGGAPGPDQDNSKFRHFRMLMAGGSRRI